MLTIKTFIAPSPIAGIGLFAGEAIQKGRVIWRLQLPVDAAFHEHELGSLDALQRQAFDTHAWRSKETGKYYLCADNARFMNHSDHPNCDDCGDFETVAARDIAAGEELTCNYHDFDAEPHSGGFVGASFGPADAPTRSTP